ncbi:peptide N-acetyl-beta-D-glucosaminyl asparaginase amidase A-domain-containing protein [Hysterangium stoloniferum]|nr:peptide N-acetyl-beta-D-glucosaminyl asparaginase amidase A-domain-containing protein [Hysterangium stoloniferum]
MNILYLLLLHFSVIKPFLAVAFRGERSAVNSRDTSVIAQPFVDFQVVQPLPLPSDVKQCTVQLLERNFANSFGNPEVIQYIPPTDCGTPGTWAGISLNWTATSNGTQFDRLSAISFHNVEIWRTSTPEPSQGLGIIWTYLKDVSRYMPLFAKPGTLILDLNNIVDPTLGLDGEYDVRLSATFFASDAKHPPTKSSDAIIPISNLSPDMANYVSVPPAFSASLNQTFPINTVEAYAELYASGNGNEEFWYFNVADQFFGDLPPDFAFPRGPFREVRLLVDGQVAGVAYPYAVFFTGAIVPPAWRPITSYGALDLPTYYIDLTPFVPILADGLPHNLALDVVSGESNHTINDNWFVSGNVQVITDPSGKQTTGKITKYDVTPFGTSSAHASSASNGDINITVDATRSLRIESDIVSGSGKETRVVWQQELLYSNTQFYLDNFNTQNVIQSSKGTSLSTHNGVPVVSDIFDFPVEIDFTAVSNGFVCFFDHSYHRELLPSPLITGTTIQERQLASAFTHIVFDAWTGQGSNNNTFTYVDLRGNSFTRKVNASSNVILLDQQGGNLSPIHNPHSVSLSPNKESWAARLLGGKKDVHIPS